MNSRKRPLDPPDDVGHRPKTVKVEESDEVNNFPAKDIPKEELMIGDGRSATVLFQLFSTSNNERRSCPPSLHSLVADNGRGGGNGKNPNGGGSREGYPPPSANNGNSFLRGLLGMPPEDEDQPDKPDLKLTFASCGGLEQQVKYLQQNVLFMMQNKSELAKWGVEPIKGIIFHGPPGSGKTLLAKALATELSLLQETPFNFFVKSGTEMFNKYVGQTEATIRSLFETAQRQKPSIIFLDEIDGLGSTRENSSPNSRFYAGVVTQLLSCMDKVKRGDVLVIAATNRIDCLDPALRRPGRFDKTLQFYLPNSKARKSILKIHSKNWLVKPSDSDYTAVGNMTVGYSGADLEQLTREVFGTALHRQFQVAGTSQGQCVDLSKLRILIEDWEVMISKTTRSNPNVFGSLVYTGESVHPTIRKLTCEIESQLEDAIITKLRSEESKGYASRRLLIWSANERAVRMVNTFVLPHIVTTFEATDGVIVNCYKLDAGALTSRDRLLDIMGQIFESTEVSVVYAPRLDTLLDVAAKVGLRELLSHELTKIRGKRILLLATGTVQPPLTVELKYLFPSKRCLKEIPKVTSSEILNFLKEMFIADKFKKIQCTHDERTSLAQFKNELSSLLQRAILAAEVRLDALEILEFRDALWWEQNSATTFSEVLESYGHIITDMEQGKFQTSSNHNGNGMYN